MLASVASMIDQFNMPNISLLLEMGYEVHVACNFINGNTCDRRRIRKLQNKLAAWQVVWHQWDCPRGIGTASRCCRAWKQLWELTGRYTYEWMHCHSPVGGAFARIVAHQRKMRVIYTAHGFHFYRGAPKHNWVFYYPLEALFAHWTEVLVTVNQEDFWFAKRKLQARKVCNIPGVGIDTGPFLLGQQEHLYIQAKKEICRQYKVPEDATILLSVGELSKRKNHRIVVEALAALHRQDVYYLILGQGALRRQLQQYAQSLGVDARIRMPGYQENLLRFYKGADIFVFPSRQEGMPMALMEAMAAGLPCVVSDIRGNRELIHDTDGQARHSLRKPGGMRFELEKPQQLEKALELLLDHTHLRQACGRYNQKRIQDYSQLVVQQRMRKIYAYMENEKVKMPYTNGFRNDT